MGNFSEEKTKRALGRAAARHARESIAQAAWPHPCCLSTRLADAGWWASIGAGLMGRETRPPSQFGQVLPKMPSAHAAQKVHS